MAVIILFFCLPAQLSGQKSSGTVDSTETNPHLDKYLLAGNLAGGTGAYFYLKDTWGTSNGRFHFKDDFNDNLHLTDEISHMVFSYKMTQWFAWLFRVLKMDERKIERYAVLETALVTTLVEFPIDAFNPDQGLGVSDLLFNYSGIALAVIKKRYPDNFDLKLSLKESPTRFENKFLAQKNEEFDNFIWWASYKPKYLWLGFGYGTNHYQGDVQSEYYLGIGTTPYDLLHLIAPALADKLCVLDTYFISLRLRL